MKSTTLLAGLLTCCSTAGLTGCQSGSQGATLEGPAGHGELPRATAPASYAGDGAAPFVIVEPLDAQVTAVDSDERGLRLICNAGATDRMTVGTPGIVVRDAQLVAVVYADEVHRDTTVLRTHEIRDLPLVPGDRVRLGQMFEQFLTELPED